MSEQVHFGVFDRDADLDVSRRFLPHWFQPNVAMFLTFRTADSLPRQAVQQWQNEQRDWLRQNGVKIASDEPLPTIGLLPESLRNGFRRTRDRCWHGHLDSCHGACVLLRPSLSSIVADSLRHFDGERYDLDSFVVMPNHVHVLVQFRPPVTCRQQCTSWLRFTAREINKAIGEKGQFWQGEPFDHLVRSAEHFKYFQDYIEDNPAKANLSPGEFILWKRVARHSVS